MADDKPNVLILGGCGFIGRHLVVYLVENELVSNIVISDKCLPLTSFLTASQQKAFEKVTFVAANLARPRSIEKVFEKMKYDYVFNCAGNTRNGQHYEVYAETIEHITDRASQLAVKHQVKRYIEVSDADVYKSIKSPQQENDDLAPCRGIARHRLEAEKKVKTCDGLNYIIVRPALVYGVSCSNQIMSRLVIGAVYQHGLKQKMLLPWNKDVKLSTVHVRDVVRALWHLCFNGKSGEVYNLADSGNTTQQTIAEITNKLFGTEFGYHGLIKTKLAYSTGHLADHINDTVLKPWSDMCKKAGIQNTTLSPYLDSELLQQKGLNVSGEKIKETGFEYHYEELVEESCMEIIEEWEDLNLFPKGLRFEQPLIKAAV